MKHKLITAATERGVIAQQARGTNPHARIQAAAVRELCGGVSDMAIWRWSNDPELGFPKPSYINRRRYWRETEIIAWLEAQPRAKAEA